MRTVRTTVLLAILAFVTVGFAGEGKPGVLVVGFQTTGSLLQGESDLARSMNVVVEALLAESFTPISADALEAKCLELGLDEWKLMASPEQRFAAAKALGAVFCVTGWACSFGSRIVIVVEVIDMEAGLPGRVVTVSTDALEKIPDALTKMYEVSGMTGDRPCPRTDDAAAEKKRDLTEIFERIPEDDLLDTYPNKAYEDLIEMREFLESPLCDEETYRRAEGLLADAVAHMHRLHSEQDYLDEYAVRLNMEKHPLFWDIECNATRHGRYLVFVERMDEPIEPLLETLDRVFAGFPTLLGAGEGQSDPDMWPSLQPWERTLKIFVFTNGDSFRSYQEKLGMPLPPGVTGYYQPVDQWLTIYLPKQEGGSRLDGWGAMKIAHEATHQLTHLYTKLATQEEIGEEFLWTDPRLMSEASWLFEGIAELVSAAAAGPGEFDPGSLHDYRLREWAVTRSQKLSEWSLEEILKIKNIGELRARARRKGLGQEGRLSSLFFAQAWSFCHFLWSFEEGRYREKFRELLREELHGRSGFDVFTRVMFGEGPLDMRDLALLEVKWQQHVEALLAEVE